MQPNITKNISSQIKIVVLYSCILVYIASMKQKDNMTSNHKPMQIRSDDHAWLKAQNELTGVPMNIQISQMIIKRKAELENETKETRPSTA